MVTRPFSAARIGIGLAMTACVATAAAQDRPAVSFMPPSIWTTGAIDRTHGWEFRVEQPVSVLAIGVYDRLAPSPEPGLGAPKKLAIWDSAGVMIASADLAAGESGRLVGRFRYADIAPLALTAGKTYTVAAFWPQSPFDHVPDLASTPAPPVTFDPAVTLIQTRIQLFTFAYPTILASGPSGCGAVNMLLAAPTKCAADCSADGRLDIGDFTCFQNAFALGDLAKADVGGPAACTPDGGLTISDFSCFQNLFALGCP